MRYHLAVAQYTRQGLKGKHWSLVAVARGRPQVEVYQLVGNTDTYKFDTKTVDLLRSASLCGGFEVGEIDGAHLDWLKETLSKIEIIKNDPNWHCQSWVIDAIRELRQPEHSDKVTIKPAITMRKIHAELAADEERWETGESNYFEDLIG
ncbi:hypothetical protein NUW54_g3812 [Trametes sanguinea]|uniref:Uncharacterized protein n=2 Tax=Trametes sanguinea TaxID=158606 RepID=A0ACC1Q395_9APHY|nr:hypothetical protein NUW54_g7801 [Trametes sanguinea]KAJ3006768.1 hypothetical protein NUW54_g3812 [Trametes sanguinea]